MTAAAVVLLTAAGVILVVGWISRGQAEMEQHIADALNLANDVEDTDDPIYQRLCFERWEAEL